MITYVIRRLLQMIPVLLGATFLIFILVYALPGEPWESRCGERPCSPAYIEKFRTDYNLDKPLPVQYILYLGKLLQGDLGTTFNQIPVTEQLASRFPNTVTLAIMAIILEIVIGIGLGVVAGITKGKLPDVLITVLTLILISMPVFVIGGLFQMIFGLKLQLLPVTASSGPPITPEVVFSLIMPAMVLASLQIAYVTRLTRTSLVENLRADYVRTAKAKGLSRNRTIGVHTLRNSLVPVVTQIGIDLGGLMGGAIVTERIFNINGVGFFLFESIKGKDGAGVVGTVTALVLIYLFANLIVDLLYGFLDPRISHD